MSRYPTRSWRAFDPQRAAPVTAAAAPVPAAVEGLRVLGLDPGSRTTGFGLVECRSGQWRHVAHGCIVAAPAGTLAERLRLIFERLSELVVQHAPAEVAIERVSVNRIVDSALKLGQARGAAICGAAEATVRFYEYAPRQIKLAVVGSGGADKAQVQLMVKSLLKLGERVAADAADALAAAVCHALRQGARSAAARASERS